MDTDWVASISEETEITPILAVMVTETMKPEKSLKDK